MPRHPDAGAHAPQLGGARQPAAFRDPERCVFSDDAPNVAKQKGAAESPPPPSRTRHRGGVNPSSPVGHAGGVSLRSTFSPHRGGFLSPSKPLTDSTHRTPAVDFSPPRILQHQKDYAAPSSPLATQYWSPRGPAAQAVDRTLRAAAMSSAMRSATSPTTPPPLPGTFKMVSSPQRPVATPASFIGRSTSPPPPPSALPPAGGTRVLSSLLPPGAAPRRPSPPHPGARAAFKAGQRVQALYLDLKYYDATVRSCEADATYSVVWYDGTHSAGLTAEHLIAAA